MVVSTSMRRWACRAVRRWRLPTRGRGPSPRLLATTSAPAQKSGPLDEQRHRPHRVVDGGASRAAIISRTAAGVSEFLADGPVEHDVQDVVGRLDAHRVRSIESLTGSPRPASR